MPPIKSETAIRSRLVNPVSIKVPDSQLVRARGLVAYEDGYADAREHGKSGFWLCPEYSPAQNLQYLTGFRAGLRVYRVRGNEDLRVRSQNGFRPSTVYGGVLHSGD